MNPTTPEEAAMQAHLDKHPDDHTTRGVLADHLDEIGDPRAAGYRALAVLGRHPYPFDPVSSYPNQFGYTNGQGTSRTSKGERTVDAKHSLPQDWLNLTGQPASDGENKYWGTWGLKNSMDYARSRKDAEDDAALAFSKLPPERQAELLERPVLPPGGAERYARRRRSLRA